MKQTATHPKHGFYTHREKKIKMGSLKKFNEIWINNPMRFNSRILLEFILITKYSVIFS